MFEEKEPPRSGKHVMDILIATSSSINLPSETLHGNQDMEVKVDRQSNFHQDFAPD